MRATTSVEFYSLQNSVQVAPPQVIINQQEDPGFSEAWDTIVAGVTALYWGIQGDWKKAGAAAVTQIDTVYNGKDITKHDSGAFSISNQGQVVGVQQPVDLLAVRYRSWSEDDLTNRFGSVD